MYNIYMSSVSAPKLRQIFCNIKNFFILDVQSFIRDMNLDMSKPSSIYLVNDEIQRLISSQATLKRNKGVIYVNQHLTETLVDSFRKTFSGREGVKLVLIDSSDVPQHEDIMHLYDEVVFYRRFRRNKIVECTGFVNADGDKSKILSIDMDENEYDDGDAVTPQG